MPKLTPHELLVETAKKIKEFSDNYKLDHITDIDLTDPLNKLDRIVTKFSKKVTDKSYSQNLIKTEYTDCTTSLTTLANEAKKSGTNTFLPNNKPLLNFSEALTCFVNETLKTLLAEYENGEKLEEKNNSERTQQSLLVHVETLTNEMKQMRKELATNQQQVSIYQRNIETVNEAFKYATIVLDNVQDAEKLSYAFKQLQIDQPPIKKQIAANNDAIKAYYAPCEAYQETVFCIEGIKFDPTSDEAELNQWKSAPENSAQYEKLKLSHSISSLKYAAICKLTKLINDNTSNASSNSFHKDNQQLINSAKSIINSIIENHDIPWTDCEKKCIWHFLDTESTGKLADCLNEILELKSRGDKEPNGFYAGKLNQIKALKTLVNYNSIDTSKTHFLDKNQETTNKLAAQITELETNAANKTQRPVVN